MSIRHVTAYVIDCDGDCRDTFGGDLYFESFDADEAVNNSDWATDGTMHWCEKCKRLPHDCVPDPEDPGGCARCGAELPEYIEGVTP